MPTQAHVTAQERSLSVVQPDEALHQNDAQGKRRPLCTRTMAAAAARRRFTHQIKSRFRNEVDQGRKDFEGPFPSRKYNRVVTDQIVGLCVRVGQRRPRVGTTVLRQIKNRSPVCWRRAEGWEWGVNGDDTYDSDTKEVAKGCVDGCQGGRECVRAGVTCTMNRDTEGSMC